MYSDGQKIAKELATQITKEIKSVKSLVYEYNAITTADSESLIILKLLKHRSTQCLTEFGSVSKTVATGQKRKIIDAY